MINRVARKRFWTPDRFYVTERVAFQNPHKISNVSKIPSSADGLFLFRVDADLYSKRGNEAFLNTARYYGITTTWFVNAEEYEKYPTALSSLVDDQLVDVQSHTYQHKIIYNRIDNLDNLRKAEEFLSKFTERKIKGVAAPYGFWNPSYQMAIDELDFAYSSEFTLAYDVAPFYPMIDNRRSSVLQIPIHPVCAGSFLSSKLPLTCACNYFEHYIIKRYLLKLPIILYGHPNDPDIEYNKKLLEHIFKIVTSLKNVKNMSFTDYYLWLIENTEHIDDRQVEHSVSPIEICQEKEDYYSIRQRIRYSLNCLIAEFKHSCIDKGLIKFIKFLVILKNLAKK